MPAIQFNHLTRAPAMLEAQIDKIVERTAYGIEAGAKANIVKNDTIDTGNMLGSVAAIRVGHMMWQIVCVPFYSIYIEMGTRFMRARPFMAPAMRAEAAKLNAARIVLRLVP